MAARLVQAFANAPGSCRVCSGDAPGVTFGDDPAGTLYVCVRCLGEAVAACGGAVTRDEHEQVAGRLGTARDELRRTQAEKTALEEGLVRLRPALQKALDEAERLRQRLSAADDANTRLANENAAFRRGEQPDDVVAEQAAAAIVGATPKPRTRRRRP